MTVFPTGHISARTPLHEVLRDARGASLVAEYMPGLAASPDLHTVHGYPIELVAATDPLLQDDPIRRSELLARLADLPPQQSPMRDAEPPAERDDHPYSDPAPRASASTAAPKDVAVYDRFELGLDGPSQGNPFTEVRLAARVSGPTGSVTAVGRLLVL